MLQRAASHAYSWWWASHIRTKQSKWLEQSLQDMEEKVQGMVSMIEGDGDSFAKRAEMYYRRRPELICAVEEAYKVFRSLADRYDLLSKDLQNANHTIATVFPEQVQFSVADDDEIPKIPENFQAPEINSDKIPQVPKAPTKDLKTIISQTSKQFQVKKLKAMSRQKSIVKSGLSKEEALEEVSKLQKEILSLQTVKEFVKSSYESGIAKYWSIESQVMDMQHKISKLQDEFNMETVIEDEEARMLMAEAALKSCQETLAMLQEKQEKTTKEAEDEYKRIQSACNRLKSLREKYMLEQTGVDDVGDESDKLSNDVADLIQETKEIEELPEKTEEHLDISSLGSLSVTQLAEKIDLLVNKVFTLETAVSSQTVLVNTLRSETDDLNSQMRNLEDENESDENKVMSARVKTMEEKLNKVRDLTKNVEIRDNTLRTNFARTHTSLHHLTKKLSSVKEDDDNDDDHPVKDEQVVAPTSPDHLSEEQSSVNADGEQEEGTNLDQASQEEVKPDEKQEAHSNLDQASQEEVMPDEEQEAHPNLDQASRELTSGEADEELEAGSNTDRASEKVGSVSTDEDKQDMDSLGESEKNLTACKTEGVEVDEDVKEERVTRKSNSKIVEKVIDGESDDAVEIKTTAQEKDDDDISWQQILLSGMEDREKILLKEYTTILRNYKEVKKKLNEMEKKERDSQFDTTLQMRVLKRAIAKRDRQIMNLHRRLISQGDSDANEDTIRISSFMDDESIESESDTNEVLSVTRDIKGPPITDENDESRVVFLSKCASKSRVEENLRNDIDAILDENLDFWFRFSSAFHQIQKFKTEVRDLEEEVRKLKEKQKQKPDSSQIKSEVMPIYKHLKEIERALTIWMEQIVPLKNELKKRCTSLCNIQEEITRALKEGEKNKFSSHQAAKLQGEVLNMKQENDKVREELEAGLNQVSMLQLQIEKTITQLNEDFGISSDQSERRSKVPLRSYLFGGNKTKKTKNSIFSYMHPSKKYQILRAGTTHRSLQSEPCATAPIESTSSKPRRRRMKSGWSWWKI